MKKIISLALAVATIMVSLVLPSYGMKGTAGDVTWSINDGTLTVSGGDITDYTASAAAPWMKFAWAVTELAVGDGVSRIGDRAFEDMTSLKTVSLGDVNVLGEMAFSGCTALETVKIPDSVTMIEDFAFAECSALKSVTVSSSLVHMGEGVFSDCVSLASFSGGSSRYYVSGDVLFDSTNSAVYRYPPKKAGKSYDVPDGIDSVADGAFRDCKYLVSADLTGVTYVDAGSFYGCSSLKEVLLPDAKQISRSSFYGCALREIKFGENLKELGDNAFSFCTELAVADFAGNAPVAGEDIFYGCNSGFTVMAYKDAGFGESWMGYPVFFHGTYSGTDFGLQWSIDSESGVMTVEGEGPIPDFEYASDSPWYEYRRAVRSLELHGITSVGDNSFRYTSLQDLVLPGSVTEVGAWAFSGCSSLEDAIIEGNVSIGECAFFGNTSLERVWMKNVTAVERQAFSGCLALLYVFTGVTAPTLGEYAFDGTEVAVLYPPKGKGYSGGEWSSVYSEEYFPGDVGGDLLCNMADVTHLMKYIANWNVTLKRVSADVNGDRDLNIADVICMLKYIAKWDIILGIE